jgi:hypothetical protein
MNVGTNQLNESEPEQTPPAVRRRLESHKQVLDAIDRRRSRENNPDIGVCIEQQILNEHLAELIKCNVSVRAATCRTSVKKQEVPMDVVLL